MLNFTENNGVAVVVADNKVEFCGLSFMVTDDEARKLKAIVEGMVANRGKATPTTPVEAPKADTKVAKGKGKKGASVKKPVKQEAPKPTKASTPTVLRVDSNGNQWIANYDGVAYATKKAEMIKDGTYDKKHREKVYKALGWIL